MKRPAMPKLSAETKTAIRKFLTRLFATLGVVLTVLLLLGLWGVRHWFFAKQVELETPKEMVLELDFRNAIVERPRDFSFALPDLLREEEEVPLFSIVRSLEAAKDDPRVKGVVAYFSSVEPPSLAQAQEIIEALSRFKESGKPTYSFAPSYGDFTGGRALVALASQFEHIWLQPIGLVGLTGLGMETPFAKTTLEKIGVRANFLRREEYKSVMENVSQDSYSPTVRANMESLLGNLRDQLAASLAQGRKTNAAKARSFLEGGPYTSKEALKEGLVTKIGYEDEMLKEVDEKLGKNATFVDPETYLYYADKDLKKSKIAPKSNIALIYAEGILTEQPKRGPYRMAGDEQIDTDEIVAAFDDAVENEKIKAILFRINSPGGSPIASESIRRAMNRAKEAKIPVIVSMGEVAASGGYWIAMDADYIVADPATLTGSIGVVGGKFVLGALYDKIGLKWETLSTSENARIFSSREAFTGKAEERMNAMLDDVYQTFLTGVSVGRKIPMEKMPDIVKGRVFTGQQALDAKLVDELGGLATALAAAKKRLNLDPKDKIALWIYPEPETPQTIVLRALKNMRIGSLVSLGPMPNDETARALAQLGRLSSRLAPVFDELEEGDQNAVRAILPAPFRLKP